MTTGRVVTGSIAHETNVFSNIKTDLERFKKRCLFFGEEAFNAFEGTKTSLGGFIDVSVEEDYRLFPTVWASAAPSGLVLRETFDCLLNHLLDGIKAAGKIDGVLLSLHGAMVVEGFDDADGCILQAVRELVGTNVPIVAELDLHANISSIMVKNADVLVAYDTYPHVDIYERGVESGKILAKLMRNEIKPTAVLKKPPMMPTPFNQKTDYHPMKKIMDLAHEIEKDKHVVNVSISPGFPWNDVPKTGFGVLVTTDNEPKLSEKQAESLSNMAWKLRRDFLVRVTPVDDAIEEAVFAEEGPIVLADISDSPAGGSPGDGTIILKKLLKLGVKNATIAAIADPEAVSKSYDIGVGNKVTMMIGGKTDDLHGNPVEVTGRIKSLSDGKFIKKGPMETGAKTDLGRTAVLDCFGVEVILTERRVSPTDLEFYRHVGIEPTKRKILVVKSGVHYRASHEAIARKIIEVDSPGLNSPRLAGFNFKRIQRPIFPLDPEMLGIVELKKFEEE